MQRQGLQAYQTLQESWPGYRASTYTVGESSKATVEVICSPCPRIIGKIFQNPGDAGMHITSVTRLRLDTTHGTTDWNEQNRRMHDNSWLTTLTFDVDKHRLPCATISEIRHIFKTPEILPRWLPCFSIIIHHSYRCFHCYIYMSLRRFPNMFLIPQHLRIFHHIHHHQHGDCRILANGMRIWHLECCYCLTSVLGRRPRPNHPRHSFRTCLHPLLLDFNQPHSMPVIWRSFIWMFCSCIKFSLHPAVVLSRWRLWEWFQQRLTNTFT